MVVNLRVSFKELVDEADWLENATRAEALAKADAIRSFMAFPEWLQNRTAIESYYAGVSQIISILRICTSSIINHNLIIFVAGTRPNLAFSICS